MVMMWTEDTRSHAVVSEVSDKANHTYILFLRLLYAAFSALPPYAPFTQTRKRRESLSLLFPTYATKTCKYLQKASTPRPALESLMSPSRILEIIIQYIIRCVCACVCVCMEHLPALSTHSQPRRRIVIIRQEQENPMKTLAASIDNSGRK